MAPKILVVLTSFDKIESINHPTGWYLPELSHPYDILAPKAELVFASPKGGKAPVDPSSIEMFKEDKSAVSFLETKKDLYEKTRPLSEFVGKTNDFDAVFYPGGHGPMFDLARDQDSQRLIADFYAQGKPVASVCHGPAAFLNVVLPSGGLMLKGKQVTGFSNAEEESVGLDKAMPFLLETELQSRGGAYEKAPEPWGEKVVVDGNLITGQNPASAALVGKELAKALGI